MKSQLLKANVDVKIRDMICGHGANVARKYEHGEIEQMAEAIEKLVGRIGHPLIRFDVPASHLLRVSVGPREKRLRQRLQTRFADLRPRRAGWTIRLYEKGGKQHAMPCHHALAEALRAYIYAAGIVEDRKGWLFRTARGHDGSALSDRAMSRPAARLMIRRRAAAAGIAAEIGCHTFRATGITAYLANGGALEHAYEMAAHESPRTTKVYDRTKERLTQDEVERIRL